MYSRLNFLQKVRRYLGWESASIWKISKLHYYYYYYLLKIIVC